MEIQENQEQETVRPRGKALTLLAVVSVSAILLDQVTKEIATKNLDPFEPVKMFGGLLYLSLTRNPGAAFSMFRDATFIFPLIALAVTGWILWMSRTLRSVPWAIGLGLVLGGALGNLMDRLFRAPSPFHGHVVDFFSLFDPHGQAFPIFNVADMALTFGVCLLVLLELLGRQRDGTQLPSRRESKKDS